MMSKMNDRLRKTVVLLSLVFVCMLAGCGQQKDTTVVRVGGLKGPTTMGILFMQDAENSEERYQFSMVTAADELVASVVREEIDIALLPANVSSVLYAKTEGKVNVIDINTLGVLYLLSADQELGAMEGLTLSDLQGKTIYLTGMGTTPDYVLRALMKANQIAEDAIHLEYKSEPAEVAAILSEDATAIGLLPQPFVTSAMLQNESLHIIMDMDREYASTFGEHMVTGVTIVRSGFLEEHGTLVDQFLEDHHNSIRLINEDPKQGAELVVNAGILPKAPVAEKAIPNCNLQFVAGEEMKAALSSYLQNLYEIEPKSIGGNIPTEDFYYIKYMER